MLAVPNIGRRHLKQNTGVGFTCSKKLGQKNSYMPTELRYWESSDRLDIAPYSLDILQYKDAKPTFCFYA